VRAVENCNIVPNWVTEEEKPDSFKRIEESHGTDHGREDNES
jgi:hypothetical protein